MAPHYPFVVPSIQQMFIGSPLCFLVGDQEAEWLGSHGYDRRQEVVQRIWGEALGGLASPQCPLLPAIMSEPQAPYKILDLSTVQNDCESQEK